MKQTWRIGRLAKATGLTIRALHFYEQIRLVVPSIRSKGGHRLYTEEDVSRLYQVITLKQLGVPVHSIEKALVQAKDAHHYLVKLQLKKVVERSTQLDELKGQLAIVEAKTGSKEIPSINDLIKVIKLSISSERGAANQPASKVSKSVSSIEKLFHE